MAFMPLSVESGVHEGMIIVLGQLDLLVWHADAIGLGRFMKVSWSMLEKDV